MITDPDLLVHGKIVPREPSRHIVIELQAAPDFCEVKTNRVCQTSNDSKVVRSQQSTGAFDIRQVEPERVEVSWRQHVDPSARLLPGQHG